MRILVIGAGPSGLIALKELREAGFDCTCVDSADALGGAFATHGSSSPSYESTRLTVSNFLMAYSCLPPRTGEPRWFWTREEYLRYLNRFVERFDLTPHIRLGVSATDLRVEGDSAVATLESGEGRREVRHDAIVVCTGSHRLPNLPDIPGLADFPGRVAHSVEYDNPSAFAGQRVLCIGIGETGVDVAHEIAQCAASTTLSLRHYPSIIKRFPFEGGHTSDAYTTRASYLLDRPTLQRLSLRGNRRRFDRARRRPMYPDRALDMLVYDWAVRSGGLYGQWFTKNAACLADIADGRITLNMGGIERVEGHTVHFRDGDRCEVDTIVCNTGYRDRFPLTDMRIDDVRDMYKHMIHPELGTRLTFIGWARPELGGVPLCSELQARYLALLLTGERTLPDRATLDRLIEDDRQSEEAYFVNARGLKTAVPLRAFCDGLATLVGCHPFADPRALDPSLVVRLLFGSFDPSHFRLVGPGAQPELARRTMERLPVLTPVSEALRQCVMLGMRRLPALQPVLEWLSTRRARAEIAAHLRAFGGHAMDPGGRPPEPA